MRKALVTGFGPYHGQTRNHTGELARGLDGAQVAGMRVAGRELPVTYRRGPLELEGHLRLVRPQVLVLCGLSPTAQAIEVVAKARNVRDSPTPDDEGVVGKGEPLVAGQPPSLASNVRIPAVLEALARRGFDARRADDAGGFLCNAVYFEALRVGRDGRCGLSVATPIVFLHMPPPDGDVGVAEAKDAVACVLETLASMT